MKMNVKAFNEISTNVFFPIYPVIAEQIFEETQMKRSGKCMDLGSGNGYLGLSIAKQTDMDVCLYDINEEMLQLAEANIEKYQLSDRVHTTLGDVSDISYQDESIDLITSRGSMFFWENRVQAFKEIYRVLKPGGYAYLGGGFGNKSLKDEIDREMLSRDPMWLENVKRRKGSEANYEEELRKAKIDNYHMINDERGFWIIIHKKHLKKIRVSVFPSCAIKVGMRELLVRYVQTFNQEHREQIALNLMDNLDIRDEKEFLLLQNSEEAFPDIILECGYGILVEPNFRKLANQGCFIAADIMEPVSKVYEKIDYVDPSGSMNLLGASMSVFVIDHTRLGDLHIPKSFKELLNPLYKDKVVIHGHGISSCDMGVMMHIHKIYGREAVVDFSNNIMMLQHFSQVAKNAGKNVEGAPPISVMPESIINMIPDKRNLSFVWPEDGLPLFPMFLTAKASIKEEAAEIINFLTGDEMGNFLAQAYFASPNPQVKNRDYSGKTYEFLGWNRIHQNGFKDFKNDLEQDILNVIQLNMEPEAVKKLRGNRAFC